MTIGRRSRPRRKGDKYDLLRKAEGTNATALHKPRRGNKFADPEDVLQGETNELLALAGQFQFRLSAHVLAKAGDASIGGWPDDPMITPIQPGLALMGPLELKKPGETLRPNQIDMQTNIGTVMADTFRAVEAYLKWFRDAHEHVRRLLVAHPLPPLPEGIES